MRRAGENVSPDPAMLSLFSGSRQEDFGVETTNGGASEDEMPNFAPPSPGQGVAVLEPTFPEPPAPRVMDAETLNRLAEGTLPNGRLYPPMLEYRSRPTSRAVSQCTSSEELLVLTGHTPEPEEPTTWERRPGSESRGASQDPGDTSSWPRNFNTSSHSQRPSISTTGRSIDIASRSIGSRKRANSEIMTRTHTPSDTTRGNSSDDDYVQDIRNALEKNMFVRTMALSKFRPWFDIIKRNDVQALENVLNNVSPQGRFHLLNLPFIYDTTLEREFSGSMYSLPTYVAASYQSSDAIIIMYDRGANLMNQDAESRDTLFHCFCHLTHQRPDTEALYINLYHRLRKQFDESTWKRTLLGDDKDGLRPLELASRLGTFGLLKNFIETENVYKFRNADDTVTYDFGEYECWDKTGRRHESPLRFLLYLQTMDLQKPYCRDVLASGPFVKYIEKKVADTRIYAYMWLLFRCVMMATFMVFAAEDRIRYLHKVGLGAGCTPTDEDAEHQEKVHKTLDILLMLTTCTILLSDLLDGIVNLTCGGAKRRFYQRPSQVFKSSYVVQWAWDRTMQAILLFCMLAYQTISYCEITYDIDDNLYRISKTVLHTMFCFLATFSILQFLKLFKFMAYFAVVLQRMTSTFICFCLVLLIFYLAFTVAVYYVMGYPCHVRQFRFMSDLFNAEQLRAENLHNSEAVIALVYVTFSILGCVFLISMGVTIIVQACKLAITCDVEIIHLLHRLDMAMTIENRVGWLVLAPCRVSRRTVHGVIKAN